MFLFGKLPAIHNQGTCMTRIKPSKEAVLGIDIGGTSIKWAVYPLINGKMGEEAIEKGKIPTKESPTDKAVPLEKHVSDVAALIRDAGVAANKRGYMSFQPVLPHPENSSTMKTAARKLNPVQARIWVLNSIMRICSSA